MSVPVFYLLPLLLFCLVVLFAFLWMIPQALFYGLVLPIFFKRPADRAAKVRANKASQDKTTGTVTIRNSGDTDGCGLSHSMAADTLGPAELRHIYEF